MKKRDTQSRPSAGTGDTTEMKMRTKDLLSAALMASALTLGSPLMAAHPLDSDDTGTLGTGHLQLELTGDAGRAEDEDAVPSAGTGFAATLGIGLLPHLDLAVALPVGHG